MIESLSLHGITRLMSISCSRFASAKLEFHITSRESRMREGEHGRGAGNGGEGDLDGDGMAYS